MIYLQNNSRYALSFTILKNNTEQTFIFDCKRIYRDTGNIATSGITEITEEDYNFLYNKCSQFKDHIDRKELEQTTEPTVEATNAEVKNLKKENEELKAELLKHKKGNKAKELEAMREENNTLKKQLEALNTKQEDKQNAIKS